MKLISKILKFILPLAALFLLFRQSFLFGLVGTLALIVYLTYKNKLSFYAFLGKFSYSRGNMDNAIKWYGRAASDPGSSPDSIISYAYLLLKTGQVDNAEQILDSYLARLTASKEKKMLARSIKALITWKRGNLDKAIETLEEVLENIETSNIYGSMGFLLIEKGNLDRALEFNLKAYDYNDSHDVILDNLGQTYYLRSEYEKSLEIYDKLMKKEPKPAFPEAYFNYGLLLLSMGKKEEAVEKMKQALDYRITFLSTITAEDIRRKIDELGDEPMERTEDTNA